MKKLFTLEQEQFIRDNYKTKTYKEIGELLGGFTSKQVRTWASSNGLRKNRIINSDYFQEINTPLKAYLLGFIYADGWIVANYDTHNFEFAMELQSEDKYVLDKINSELGGTCMMVHSNPYEHEICGIKTISNHRDCIRVFSKQLVLDLINHGIETNKTQKDIFPIVSNDLFFDWLRGYIDGDGCFYKYKKYIYLSITCSNDTPLKYIRTKLSKYKITTSIYKEKEKKYRLMCTDTQSMSILVNYLYYDNVFCLKRKYEKVKQLLGLVA